MTNKKINEFSFIFKQESCLVVYNKQQISVNNYYQPNKRPLKRFITEIQTTRKMDLDKLYKLARLHNLNVMGMGLEAVHNHDGTTKVIW